MNYQHKSRVYEYYLYWEDMLQGTKDQFDQRKTDKSIERGELKDEDYIKLDAKGYIDLLGSLPIFYDKLLNMIRLQCNSISDNDVEQLKEFINKNFKSFAAGGGLVLYTETSIEGNRYINIAELPRILCPLNNWEECLYSRCGFFSFNDKNYYTESTNGIHDNCFDIVGYCGIAYIGSLWRMANN